MKSSLDYVFYATLFLSTAGVTGRITSPPLNAVAEVGSQAIFNCTSELTVPNWIFSKTREEVVASTGQTIVANCAVLTGFGTHYEAVRPGGSNNQCNLIVKATTMQQAGVYTCSSAQTGPSAILTVINRDASITVSSQPETVEGETVTMSYTVSYNSSTASSETPTIQPFLTWTDSDGNTLTSSPSVTNNSVYSSISVTAGRQDIRPYTCHISYTSPSTRPSFASNTPKSVSKPPTTSNINVSYAPIISSIKMSHEVPVCPGKAVEITCHATANPTPTYSWIGPDSRNYSGATIEVVMNGTYTCNATNVIRESVRSDTKETTLTVLCWLCLLLLLWFLNPISAGIFLVHYKCSQDRDDFNKRYLFLEKMLPCMNNSQETPCRKAGWITLFIVMATFSGIQFLILTIVTYAGCLNPVVRYQDLNPSAEPASEEQSNASHAAGTRFQKICFALALAYMILGMILFAISVGVIYYECNRQCYKR